MWIAGHDRGDRRPGTRRDARRAHRSQLQRAARRATDRPARSAGRIALPGVQVLFAFLLTVPFAQGFSQLTGFERGVYFAVLLLTAFACALLIAPTAYHRLQFRRGQKEDIL